MTVADRRSQFIVDVAGPGDDAESCSLFRNIPMHGAIRVALYLPERVAPTPDFKEIQQDECRLDHQKH
jgi:hypothetical protein